MAFSFHFREKLWEILGFYWYFWTSSCIINNGRVIMKKHNLLKVVLIAIVATFLLTWILPTISVQYG